MSFYRVTDDILDASVVPGRWHLGNICHVNNWDLLVPPIELMEVDHWVVVVQQDGVETDFSSSGYGRIPIVSQRVRNSLSDLPDCSGPLAQTIFSRVAIRDRETRTGYFVMMTESPVDCIDENRSTFDKFTIDDPVRPDLAGDYRYFTKLIVDPDSIGDRQIFRVKGAPAILIVSQTVKERFEAIGATGASFVLVSEG